MVGGFAQRAGAVFHWRPARQDLHVPRRAARRCGHRTVFLTPPTAWTSTFAWRFSIASSMVPKGGDSGEIAVAVVRMRRRAIVVCCVVTAIDAARRPARLLSRERQRGNAPDRGQAIRIGVLWTAAQPLGGDHRRTNDRHRRARLALFSSSKMSSAARPAWTARIGVRLTRGLFAERRRVVSSSRRPCASRSARTPKGPHR